MPISRLAECVTETQADIERERLVAPIVGHVGDGNFHLTMLVDPDRRRRGRAAPRPSSARLNLRAIAMDGTCTGEHGVGQGKMKYLADRARGRGSTSCGRSSARSTRSNIMNPGKIVAAA